MSELKVTLWTLPKIPLAANNNTNIGRGNFMFGRQGSF